MTAAHQEDAFIWFDCRLRMLNFQKELRAAHSPRELKLSAKFRNF